MVIAPTAEQLLMAAIAEVKDARKKKKEVCPAVGAALSGSNIKGDCHPAVPEEEGDEEQSSSCSSGRPKVPKYFADGRFQLRKKLGSGSYSDVYAAFDTMHGDQVAAKFEWTKAEKTGKLLAEAKLCQAFAERRCSIPFVRWVGTQGEYNIMVMDVLGPSLEDQLDKCGGSFSLRTVLMIGEQMVTLLEYVHQCGIIHRDIKPNNFLIGVGDRRDRVYIVDFGLAKRYIDPETAKHIPCIKKKGLTGTVRYTTMNIHRGHEPARRDDLGSVGYVLMYFALGRLPWQGISGKSKKTKQRRIGRRKEKVSHQELCKGYPEELLKYLEYCDELEYEAKPDYDYLRGLLRSALARDLAADPKVTPLAPATFDWLLPEDQRPPPAPNAKRKRPSPPNKERGAVDDVCMAIAEACSEAKRRRLEGQQKAVGGRGAGDAVMAKPDEAAEADEDESSYESYEYETEEEYDYEESEEEEEDKTNSQEQEDEESEEEEEDEEDEDDEERKDSKDSKKESRDTILSL